MAPPIDFPGLARALLQRAHELVSAWYPAGYEKSGRWYIGNLDGSPGKSCNIDLRTGTWIDNGTDEKGGDLISLYAAKNRYDMGAAARELMADLGLAREGTRDIVQAPARAALPDRRPEPPPDAEPGKAPPVAKVGKGGRPKAEWQGIAPVPETTPKPDFKHFHHGQPDRTWEYRYEDKLYGYVCRFDKPPSEKRPNGGKEILPFTWCVDKSDGRGLHMWVWRQWEQPRPLFVPATILAEDPRLVPVVIVEGEKCAEAGLQLLGHEFDFVTWPGGGQTWHMADWSWLRGRVVYLWPDCDAQRERLTKADQEAGLSAESKPIKPSARQPGMKTMVGIGSLLLSEFGCQVLMCPIPEPGAVSDGWDIADAIELGNWSPDMVRSFIRKATAFKAPDDAVRAATRPLERSTPASAGAGDDDGDGADFSWKGRLLCSGSGAVKACRENVVLAMEGMDDPKVGRIPGIPEVYGLVAFNEFTNDLMKMRDTPWGSRAGVWEEVDELLMGEWLTRHHFMPTAPRGTLEEAIRMVAYRHRYHPVRAYLSGLKWDRQPRLSTWLRKAVMVEDEWDNRDPLQRYLARVGTWFLQGMCARAMQPGVKFDYMLILEGAQGLRKSTLLATLAGDWFADTGLVLGEKDSYQQLQGRWLYEFPELDAFSKADVTKIKAFIASQSDYFRASFDKRARDYPRQIAFSGTTNEEHYLTDPTGNRRMWPVAVGRVIDIDWVIENRDQLFAEAMVRYTAGARMHPTPEEERELFKPQQKMRTVESSIYVSIYRYLQSPEGALAKDMTVVELLGKVGITLEKLTPGRFHERQATAALRDLGWEEKKASKALPDSPSRPMLWSPPRQAQQVAASANPSTSTQDIEDEELDGCPF